jgi:hypothetical protein
MFKVNYRSEAGLYHPVQRGSKPGRAAPIGYKRFKSVTAAIRFASEQLPSYGCGPRQDLGRGDEESIVITDR